MNHLSLFVVGGGHIFVSDISVGSVYTETVYRLIAVVVCDVERPHKRIMVDSFCGRLDTSGTAVRTMKNTSYPKYQTMKLSTPVLTAAHRAFYIFFDILIAVI